MQNCAFPVWLFSVSFPTILGHCKEYPQAKRNCIFRRKNGGNTNFRRFLLQSCAHSLPDRFDPFPFTDRSGIYLKKPSIRRDYLYLPWNHLAAVLQCRLYCMLQAATAWNLHPYDQHILDIVLTKDLRELFAVIHII